ncbi:MAG: hypothetical protein EBU46_04760 [Nitrosomonadaceae bacterium]|nr:hypothetical protein [Nitrosomonadaceae bacterium]
MPIIRPTRKFDGGEMGNQNNASILKPGIPFINFKEDANKNGAKVFLLGAYKADAEGNGIWYRVVKIRDNFGLDTKEKFAVQPNCPVEWFASKVKSYAPNYAKVEEVVKDNRKQKVYPSFGRTTYRVIFNAAYVNRMELGAHVLDIPQWNCGSVIYDWCQDPEKPMLNDYAAAIPVNFKLEKGNTMGNPWQVTIESFKSFSLPPELADTDYLHNLDEVVVYPDKAKLLEKLRASTPNDLFNRCMAGYSDGTVAVSFSGSADNSDDVSYGAPASAASPTPTPTKQVTIPKARPVSAPATTTVAPTVRKPVAAAPAPVEAAANDDAGEEDLPTPPVITTGTGSNLSVEQARQFLRRPAQAAA